ncbi:MAG: YIP1 family protein [Candidatus Gottesmanbacteria bacterium]|nr:YIP1 family protein [Candidatus Gottesmanbacteria bacterium]
METSLIVALVDFGSNVVGLVTRPYETCRRIVDHGGFGELIYVAILLAMYFVFASLVKVASFRPFLLSRQFIVLSAATGVTYLFAVALFWTAGKLVGAEGKLKGLAVSWGYSLLATLTWFLATSILYVILPPPRTTSTAGILFSILFLIFSVTLFFWKATIAYLTLRFGLRLNLGKIFVVLALTLPVLGLYSFGMYRLGIFRVPFL